MGMIALDCARCKKPTYWTYAETDHRPRSLAVAEAVAPPRRVVPIQIRQPTPTLLADDAITVSDSSVVSRFGVTLNLRLA